MKGEGECSACSNTMRQSGAQTGSQYKEHQAGERQAVTGFFEVFPAPGTTFV
ncbi:hypothetical protein PSCICF_25650 [Pseudomonas cichorii]|nr:hypothetical protein PSCICF_25650 [Pseudomonas cichorii]